MDYSKLPAMCLVISTGDTVIYLAKSKDEWVEPCIVEPSYNDGKPHVAFTPLNIFGASSISEPVREGHIISGPYVPDNDIEMTFRRFLAKYFEDINRQAN